MEMCIIGTRQYYFFLNAEDLTVLPALRKCILNSQDNLELMISSREKSYIQVSEKMSFGMCEGVLGMQNKSINGHRIYLVEEVQQGWELEQWEEGKLTSCPKHCNGSASSKLRYDTSFCQRQRGGSDALPTLTPLQEQGERAASL